jgi:hypothetical protein
MSDHKLTSSRHVVRPIRSAKSLALVGWLSNFLFGPFRLQSRRTIARNLPSSIHHDDAALGDSADIMILKRNRDIRNFATAILKSLRYTQLANTEDGAASGQYELLPKPNMKRELAERVRNQRDD